MDEVTKAFTDALVSWMPELFGALAIAVIGLLGWIPLRLAAAREAMATSAVRQALDMHGDHPLADQAAAHELNQVPPKHRPKDIKAAVQRALERERAIRVTERPPRPITPLSASELDP